MGYDLKKPDHVGAKNGGGYWSTRSDAKAQASHVRRQQAKAAVREQLPPEGAPQ